VSYIALTDTPITELGIQQGASGGDSHTSPTAGQTLYFSATATGSNVQYLWDFGDDTLSALATASGQYVHHRYDAPGSYTVTLTARNGADEQVTTRPITIGARAVNELALHGPSKAQVNTSLALSATVAAGDSVSYAWDFGDGATSSGQAVAHSYAEAGLYTVTVTASNSVNAQTAAKQITIQAAGGGDKPVSALALNGPDHALVDFTVSLNATVDAGDHVGYAWSFGDGASGSGQAVTHTYTKAGRYTITLTASNSQGEEEVSREIVVQHGLLMPRLAR
jgi:PKD repeat protein